MTEWRIHSGDDLAKFHAFLAGMEPPFRVSVVKGEDRTKAQNRYVHKLFGEIAAQRGDVTEGEVKAECNLQYGRPILSRDDPEWETVFGYLFRGLDHERKLKAIRILDVPFTRRMVVAQLGEYIDNMTRDYRAEGFRLTDPELYFRGIG